MPRFLPLRFPTAADLEQFLPYWALLLILGLSLLVNAALLFLNAKHRELALRDMLTGIPNRLAGERAVKQLDRRRRWSRLVPGLKIPHIGVLELDIDHFKRQNTEQGHGGGDHALKEIGRIGDSLKGRGINFIRVGGEEFRFLLVGATKQTALEFAEKVRQALNTTVKYKPVDGPERDISLSVSIGVAIWEMGPLGGTSMTFNQVVERADKALETAKQTGRNRIEWGSARAPERLTTPESKPGDEKSGQPEGQP